MPNSECSKCHEPIIWAVSKNGKNMPMDEAPVSTGKFSLERWGDDDKQQAVYLGRNDPYTGERYDCHFDTCSEADSFRKRRG